jgi:hypothetical protein
MIKRERYENIKNILNIYYETAAARKTLEEKLNIEKDSTRPIITRLNKMNLLDKQGNFNKLKEDLWNKTIFYDKKFNIELLASLAYSEEEDSKEIMEYIFKTTISNLIFSIANKYSKSLQENMKELIDKKKYNQFTLMIKENKKENISKNSCEIKLISTRETKKIIPLEFFIFDKSWFICAYFIGEKKIGIIDSKDIENTINNLGNSYDYIDYRDVEKHIKDYIINENKKNEEFVILRLNPETLSLLIEFGLLIQDNYELFEDNMKDQNRLFFLNQSTLNEKLSKINIYETNINTDIEEKIIYDKKIHFYEDDSRKYIIKTKLTRHKLNLILNFFSEVELLNKG